MATAIHQRLYIRFFAEPKTTTSTNKPLNRTEISLSCSIFPVFLAMAFRAFSTCHLTSALFCVDYAYSDCLRKALFSKSFLSETLRKSQQERVKSKVIIYLFLEKTAEFCTCTCEKSSISTAWQFLKISVKFLRCRRHKLQKCFDAFFSVIN